MMQDGDLFQSWQDEQRRIANQVIIKKDPMEQKGPPRNEAFKCHQNIPKSSEYCCGSINVSFPNNKSDPSLAVYFILNESGTIIYIKTINVFI